MEQRRRSGAASEPERREQDSRGANASLSEHDARANVTDIGVTDVGGAASARHFRKREG